jgi:glutathione S-transferase
MSIIFFTAPQSTATLTDLIFAELGTPHDRKVVDLKGDKSELLKVNPNGKVPVIVHDGVAIAESAAITMYLGEQFGVEKKLWPAAGPKRGQAMMWVTWTNVTLGDAVYRRGRASGQWGPDFPKDDHAMTVATKDIGHLLGILDKQLEGKHYVLGADYSLVDAHMTSFLDWLRYSKVDFTPFTHITEWAARCTARPAYKQVMAAMAH